MHSRMKIQNRIKNMDLNLQFISADVFLNAIASYNSNCQKLEANPRGMDRLTIWLKALINAIN